jgi:hypothetical protein
LIQVAAIETFGPPAKPGNGKMLQQIIAPFVKALLWLLPTKRRPEPQQKPVDGNERPNQLNAGFCKWLSVIPMLSTHAFKDQPK